MCIRDSHEPSGKIQSAAGAAQCSKTWRKFGRPLPTRQRLGVRRPSAAFEGSAHAEFVRFMESRDVIAAVHWNHEPTPSPSKEGSRAVWPVPLLGGVRGGFSAGIDRFMGRESMSDASPRRRDASAPRSDSWRIPVRRLLPQQVTHEEVLHPPLAVCPSHTMAPARDYQ